MNFYPPMLPQDKANHLFYGALIGVLASGAAIALGHPELARAVAPMAAGLAGVLKEASDAAINYHTTGNPMTGPHSVEFLDFAATLSGGVLVGARP
jgi:hypothetical protein